ncbi:hypothetical protein [Mucilaginibacter sp.]|uniref:hypothetical protein n=1 Tax=Mucilaginibacter sp. TaxID=1882438 RepID=UPI0032659833
MKKHLTLSLSILLGLAACKKDAKVSTPKVTPATGTHKTVNTVMPDYVDLTLIPRAPGQDFDTYRGYWNDCGIEVRGPVIYNTQKYPTLVNGVPVSTMSLTTYDGNSTVNYSNTGPDGSVFAVTQMYMGSTDFAQFHTDVKAYLQASDDYFAGGLQGAPPILASYVKDHYTNASSTKTYVGKLIRVTTGSHLAVAKFDYVLPPAAAPAILPLPRAAIIADGVDPHKSYQLIGANGKITEAAVAIDDFANGGRVIATGSYTHTGGQFQYWGTIITADGREIKFNDHGSLD